MPVPDFESHKVAHGEVSSAAKFNTFVQAVEDEFGDIDADQIPGFPSSAAAFLRGDGAWAGAYTTSFVPVWSSSGTAPAIGNGTITSRYLQIGKLVHYKLVLTAGSTTTFGTGDWRFTMPVAAAAADAGGQATFFDSSGSAVHHGLARFNGTLLRAYTNASPAVLVDASNPFAWATSDFLELDLVYEAS